jgi:hypothetical protein
MKIVEIIAESDGGTTTSAMMGTVISPHLAIGNKSTRKKYGKGGNPNPPKAIQAKNKDGTAKNALDMKTSIFGGSPLKR